MSSEVERQFRSDLLEWGQQNRRDYAWCESDRTLYEVFVAEFFLTQTPADNVVAVYPTFLEQFPRSTRSGKQVKTNSSKLSNLSGSKICAQSH